MGRQVQIWRGSSTLDLNDSTYVLQAENGWVSEPGRVTVRLAIKATTLAQLDRLLAPIHRRLTQARLYHQEMAGDPIYLYTKTCDNLTTVAELGATWMRRMIYGGTVSVSPATGTAAVPAAFVSIVMDTDEAWQRAAAAPILEPASALTTRSDGGISATATGASLSVYARRMSWTSTTGISGRWFWSYADVGTDNVNVLKLSANWALYWSGSAKRFYFADNGGTTRGQSGVLSFTAGQAVEIAFSASTGAATLYVNGVSQIKYSGTVTWPANPDTYRVWEPTGTATAAALSIQIWPTTLTETQLLGLVSTTWGQPEAELAWCTAPSDDKATNAQYPIYNVPGHLEAPLRIILHSAGAQDYSQVRMALRPMRIPSTRRWECESGTLGAATAANSNSDASGGSQARFTPAATSWSTQVTVTLAANPTNVAALIGDHRLYLAGYDSAATVQVNQVRWRLVLAGVAGDWSDAYAFAAVSSRSLLDLGTVSIPPGNWPAETLAAATTGYGSAYITLELQMMNTTGSGGGTLDLDAVWLAPAEMEGVATATLDVSDVDLLVGFVSAPPVAMTIQDSRSLEFGGWATWVGDDLLVPPMAGDAGLLWLFWYRNAAEQAFPNDTCDVWLAVAPRWR